MKIKRLFLILFLGFILFLGACEKTVEPTTEPTNPTETEVPRVEEVGINVDTSKVKLEYTLNEELDLSNLKVYVLTLDGNFELSSTAYTLDTSLVDKSKIGKYEINVTYKQFKESFFVTYIDSTPKVTEVDLKLDTSKVKLSYLTGETLNLDGLKVEVVYSDKTTKELSSEDYQLDISSIDINNPASYKVIIKYKNLETHFMVTYEKGNEPKEIALSLDTRYIRLEYNLGETVDVNGIGVKVIYDNETSSFITDFEVDLTEVDINTIGEYKVYIRYKTFSDYFVVRYNESSIIQKEISSIYVDFNNAKVNYLIGENISVEGLKVYVNYSDGSNKEINFTDYNIDISEVNNSVEGTYKIYINYKGFKDDYYVVYTKEVDENPIINIEVDLTNFKTDYYLGEEIDKTGMKVYAVYLDGTKELVEDYTLTEFDNTTIGYKEFYINYLNYQYYVIVKYNELITEKDIQINTKNIKYSYYLGEIVDLNGLEVKLVYSNNTTKNLNSDEYIVDLKGVNINSIGIYTIKISYKNFVKTFDVEFIKKPEIIDMTFDFSLSKDKYLVGEQLLLESIIILIYYDNGDVLDLYFGDVTIDISKVDINKEGTYEVNVTYQDYSKSFEVIYTEPVVLESLVVDTSGMDLWCYIDSYFIYILDVTAIYSDGSKEKLEAGFYTIDQSAVDTSKAGTYVVKVSYKELVETFEVKVIPMLNSIKVNAENMKLKYALGETIDYEGLEVIGVYSDNSEGLIDLGECEFTVPNITLGEVRITVSYNNCTTRFSVYYYEKLDAPTVKLDKAGGIYLTNCNNAYIENIIIEINGEEHSFTLDDNIINNYNEYLFYELLEDSTFKVKYTGKELYYALDSDYTESFEYKSVEYIELSKDVNPLKDLVDKGNGTYLFTAKTSLGNDVNFLIKGNITAIENGWAEFVDEASITALDATFGTYYLSYEFVEGYFGKGIYLQNNFNLSGEASVENTDELDLLYGKYLNDRLSRSELESYPDYVGLQQYEGSTNQIKSMRFYFNNTPSKVVDFDFFVDKYGAYLEGDMYHHALEESNLTFYLKASIGNETHPLDKYEQDIYAPRNYVIGDIISKDNERFDRINHIIKSGDKLEVTLAGIKKELELTVDRFTGTNAHQTSTTQFINSIGTQNVLVVPVVFEDHINRINEDTLTILKNSLGKVVDAEGNITDYKHENGQLSLSSYYNTSSYGKFDTVSYITENYYINGTSDQYRDYDWTDEEINKVEAWLYALNLDLNKYDQNDDGIIDSLILVNTLDMNGYNSFIRVSYAGAYLRSYYYDNNANTLDKPGINSFMNINLGYFYSNNIIGDESNASTHTILHEFGHYFGLADYYDVDSKGINTIGYYDMMSNNNGDMNAHTKYILGWIEPIVVDGSQDEYDITIDPYSTSGDTILIYAKDHENKNTPFDEYILIDLYADDNLYANDEYLKDSLGVRIYHVNAAYEQRTYINKSGEEVILATPHFTCSDSTKYRSQGKFYLELISRINNNEFTPSDGYGRDVLDSDLFKEGDIFDVASYDEFFFNGLMDNYQEFGYVVTIEAINTSGDLPQATINIKLK